MASAAPASPKRVCSGRPRGGPPAIQARLALSGLLLHTPESRASRTTPRGCSASRACGPRPSRRGWPAWGRAFGVNAIAAYAGSAFLLYALVATGWLEPLYRRGFADWMTPRFGPYVPSLAYALAFWAAWWLVVRALDARRIYFKI